MRGFESEVGEKWKSWARDKILEFEYRKLFGLSYEEFLREPIDSFMVNLGIQAIKNQIEQEEIEKQKKKIKG